MMVWMPAALQTVYRVGMAEYRLCAGRLIDPRIVPPCQILISTVNQQLVFNPIMAVKHRGRESRAVED
jgi:hypothetical protein